MTTLTVHTGVSAKFPQKRYEGGKLVVAMRRWAVLRVGEETIDVDLGWADLESGVRRAKAMAADLGVTLVVHGASR